MDKRRWTTPDQKYFLDSKVDEYLAAKQRCDETVFMGTIYGEFTAQWSIDVMFFRNPEIYEGTPEEVVIKKTEGLKEVSCPYRPFRFDLLRRFFLAHLFTSASGSGSLTTCVRK